ncbi:MAG: DNA mismatch repair endonuclease MutL [Cyclobacteriaceae bacterium]
MPDIIKLLPDAIANQIAAGEVVQRPASVVKELMENAIDAGAMQVQLILKDAGRTLIQVVDNGKGMTETDARMSFERHATSKIRASEDLFSIRTMGFRGEALASIAAVAQVEMKTRQYEQEVGTLLLVEGSQLKKQEPVACTPGTSIVVKNLFFNVPARRNFLKSNPVEMRHIMDEFQRIALANPEVGFSMYQNDVETYQLKPAKLGVRIVDLMGKNYRSQLIACSESSGGVSVLGYIGKPESSKKSRSDQYFFVNNRYIKSNYLNHAINTAYNKLIPEDHHPFYVLFIEIDPKHIDVNVHPTKTEIKFDDERSLYALLHSCVKMTLGTNNITPSIDFSFDVNFMNHSTEISGHNFPSSASKSEGFSHRQDTRPDHSKWTELYRIAHDEERFEKQTQALLSTDDLDAEDAVTMGSAANDIISNNTLPLQLETNDRIVFQIHGKYLATQVKSGLMLLDQKAALFRILFERNLKILKNLKSVSQQCLFPETITLNPKDYSLVMEIADELSTLGFALEPFGPNTLAINGVPADLESVKSTVLLETIIEECKNNFDQFVKNKNENLAKVMAKYAAQVRNPAMGRQEMILLIDQLFACENPNYAPDGQLCFFILELGRIAQLFNKST